MRFSDLLTKPAQDSTNQFCFMWGWLSRAPPVNEEVTLIRAPPAGPGKFIGTAKYNLPAPVSGPTSAVRLVPVYVPGHSSAVR